MDEVAGGVIWGTGESGGERVRALGEVILPVSAQHGGGQCGWTMQARRPLLQVSGEQALAQQR
jgi:hypothetical protein